MRNPTLLPALALLLVFSACSGMAASSPPSTQGPRVFEMRTYTANPGKLADLERRFRDHTTRLFERHGMTNIGYWIPQDSLSTNTLIYILAYPSREAAGKCLNLKR